MEAGDWATWVGSTAAVVAAGTSVALLVRSRAGVTWQLQAAISGRSRVLNTGSRTAKQVQVRVGSASDETDIEALETAMAVAPGEVVPVMVAVTFGSRADVAVVVTWRGRTGRTKRWTHLLT